MSLRPIYPLLFFIAVVLLAFWKVIFHGDFTLLAGGDMNSLYFPWFDVSAYWLKKGVFLLWDPYVYAGKSFMGEPQPGIFYPLNWVFMLLPARSGGINLDGLQALLILDYLLAAYFFYLLARSLTLSPYGAALAGISFALGGYTAQLGGYVNAFSGFVWMPLVLLCFHKALTSVPWKRRCRWTLASGSCLALTFLPGHHVPAVHTALLLAGYAVFVVIRDWRGSARKSWIGPLVILGSVGIIAALITALQWLPSAEWARHVYRWVGEGDPVRLGDRIPYSRLQRAPNILPQDMLSLVFPYLSTGANMYTGCVVVFLALLGILFVRQREAQFFTFAAIAYFFLSWGQFSALHGWVNTFLPGLWFAREVHYYLVLFQACIALLAGWGLDHLVAAYTGDRDAGVGEFVRRAGWGISVLVAGSAGVLAGLRFLKDVSFDHPYVTACAGLATFLFVLGLALFMLHTGRIQAPLFRGLMIAAVCLDLSSQISRGAAEKNRPSRWEDADIRFLWKKTPAMEHLRALRNQEFFRVDDPDVNFPRNYGDVLRLDATMGYGATGLVDYFDFRGTGWAPASNASALLNVRYVVSRVPVPGMSKVLDGEQPIYRNVRAVPRAFVVSQYRAFRSGPELLEWLKSPLLNPRETVLLTEEEASRLPSSWLEGVRNEDDGIQVRIRSHRTILQKKAQTARDHNERLERFGLEAPWGWSVGDELSISLRPETRLEHCFVIFDYYPTGPDSSRLALVLESPREASEIKVELPGALDLARETELPRRAAVDLGPLAHEEYRLSISKTEACSANIDSLRIARLTPGPGEPPAGTATIILHEPHRVTVAVELARPSFVVLSEVFYPGWEAFIDGKAAPILRGDHVLRTVPVPAGKHTVEFRYRSKTFQWGLAVSLLSLAALGIAMVMTRPSPSRHGVR
jgi:hypothetical protein